jgi:peptide deformylase
MTIRPILTLPEPALRRISAPVEQVDDELRRLAADMLETRYDAPGIGLAAPQVGVLRRMFVMDVAKDDAPPDPVVLVNPEIVELSGAPRLHEEGCLSIPEFYAEIERPGALRVRYVDLDGKKQETAFEDLRATVVQHEVDHLNGVLFIDYLSRLKRDMVVKKMTKAKKSDSA